MPEKIYNIYPSTQRKYLFIREPTADYQIQRKRKTQYPVEISTSAATSTNYLSVHLFAEMMEKKSVSITYPFIRLPDLQELEQPIEQEEILNLYEMEDDEQNVIRGFVNEHSYLLPILKTAKDKIISVFGRDIRILLELHHDPEEDFEELFVVIKSLYSAKDTRKLMNKLDNKWFLKVMDKTKGKLNITEEPL